MQPPASVRSSPADSASRPSSRSGSGSSGESRLAFFSFCAAFFVKKKCVLVFSHLCEFPQQGVQQGQVRPSFIGRSEAASVFGCSEAAGVAGPDPPGLASQCFKRGTGQGHRQGETTHSVLAHTRSLPRIARHAPWKLHVCQPPSFRIIKDKLGDNKLIKKEDVISLTKTRYQNASRLLPCSKEPTIGKTPSCVAQHHSTLPKNRIIPHILFTINLTAADRCAELKRTRHNITATHAHTRTHALTFTCLLQPSTRVGM